MKIVSVMTTEAWGGAEFAAVQMLEALADRGHEVVWLSNLPPPEGSSLAARHIDLGPKLSRSSWRMLLVRWPVLLNRLQAALQAELPYDVLLVHFKKEQLLAAQLPGQLRGRLVWREWGPVPFPLRRPPARWLYARAARPVSCVLAVSEGTRASVRQAGVPAERVAVVPNVVPVRRSGFTAVGRARVRGEYGIPGAALVVGTVSRFNVKKRNDVLVDAVCRLDRSDVHLVLAGEGDQADALRAQAAPLGSRAHFLPTPGSRIAEVMSALDLAVFCPSPTEGAPLAIIFAMLARRPCVASGREGAEGMIPEGTGMIVSPEHDPEALALAIAAYLDDPARLGREGRAAHVFAERAYAPDAVADRIVSLLSPANP